MNINEINSSHKEVALLKKKLKRSYLVSKAVYEYSDYIYDIKQFIAEEDLQSASGYWNDLEYNVQQLLYTAPLYGGVFTTSERSIIKSFWKISVEDVEAQHVSK